MNEPVRPEDLRISDVDRERVQDQLRHAQAAGQLDIPEFDERTKGVWAARTRGELARVTADLPELPPPAPTVQKAVFSDTGGGTAMRVLTIIWASLLTVNVVVWGILALTGIVVYPWFVWVLVPGAVLGVLYGFGVGRPEQHG